MVGTPTRRCGRGRETLMEVRKWSVHPPGGPDLVVGHSWRSGTCLETHPEVLKWSGDPLRAPEVVEDPPGEGEVVGRLSRRYGSGWETLPEV